MLAKFKEGRRPHDPDNARAILVGEDNPHSVDPRYALYPYPPNCAGHRLQDKVLGVGLSEYLGAYRRVNLCEGRWRAAAAREKAGEILRDCRELPLVLLGAKVAAAFGQDFRPFTVRWLEVGGRFVTVAVLLPHPSGRCRVWNDPGSYERARGAMRSAGVVS